MSGFVYFADADSGQGVKVGYSKNPYLRIRDFVRGQRSGRPQIQSLALIGCVPGVRSDESRVHTALAVWRVRGQRELFRTTPEVREIVRLIIEAGAVPDPMEATVEQGKRQAALPTS